MINHQEPLLRWDFNEFGDAIRPVLSVKARFFQKISCCSSNCQFLQTFYHPCVLKNVQEQKNVCKYWRSDKQSNIFWKKILYLVSYLDNFFHCMLCLSFQYTLHCQNLFIAKIISLETNLLHTVFSSIINFTIKNFWYLLQ